MWFKNIFPFQLNTDNLDFHSLEDQLLSKPLVWPAPTQAESYGWVNAIGETIIHGVSDCILMRLGHHKRNLPAKVVNAELLKRVRALEDSEGRKVSSREKTALKEDITFEMLPKAFVESDYTDAWIDTKTGALYIDTASAAKAEQFTKELRKTLGSLPVTLAQYANAPEVLMTRIIQSETEFLYSHPVLKIGGEPTIKDLFQVTYNCKIEGADKDAATYKNIDLKSESVTCGLEEGRQVTELGLCWSDKINLTLTKDGLLKGISFGEALEVQLMETEIESADQRRDTEFALMSGEIRQLFASLESPEVLGLVAE